MCLCRSACSLCVSSADAEADAEAEAGAGAGADVAAGSLALLEAVVSYSLLPRSALRPFVAALCRTVNLEPYCETSWKVHPVHRGASCIGSILRNVKVPVESVHVLLQPLGT